MRSLAILALAGALASGCLSSDSGDGGASDADGLAWDGPVFADGTPAPAAMDYTECSEQLGVFPAPSQAMEAYLPEGFQAVPFDDAGATVAVISVAYTCLADGEPVSEFGGGLAVLPPEELRSDGVDEYAVVLGWVTNREASHRVFQAWTGNGTYALGDVEVEATAPENPVARVGDVRGSDGASAVRMTTVVPALGDAETPGGVRLFIVDGASLNVTSAIDFSWTASSAGSGQGTALLTFDEGFLGLLPNPNPGIAFHYWGDYAYHLEHVALE